MITCSRDMPSIESEQTIVFEPRDSAYVQSSRFHYRYERTLIP